MIAAPRCRFCATPLRHTFIDLGLQPLANSNLTAEQLAAGTERSYPLHARVCHACFLVQVDDVVPAEAIFDQDYAYFSSYSATWVAHAKRYAGHVGAATMLAGHIRNGSSGTWGGGMMPPHPNLSPVQATAIAQWIVANANDPSVHYSIGKSGSFSMIAHGKPGAHAGMVLSAYYAGPIKAGESRAGTGRNTVVISGS